MKQELCREERRILVVLYDLAGGSTEVPVLPSEIEEKIEELGILTMSDEEFRAYHLAVVARVEKHRARLH